LKDTCKRISFLFIILFCFQIFSRPCFARRVKETTITEYELIELSSQLDEMMFFDGQYGLSSKLSVFLERHQAIRENANLWHPDFVDIQTYRERVEREFFEPLMVLTASLRDGSQGKLLDDFSGILHQEVMDIVARYGRYAEGDIHRLSTMPGLTTDPLDRTLDTLANIRLLQALDSLRVSLEGPASSDILSLVDKLEQHVTDFFYSLGANFIYKPDGNIYTITTYMFSKLIPAERFQPTEDERGNFAQALELLEANKTDLIEYSPRFYSGGWETTDTWLSLYHPEPKRFSGTPRFIFEAAREFIGFTDDDNFDSRDNLVDFGVGTGDFIEYLVRFFRQGNDVSRHLFGFDNSEKMLEVARQRGSFSVRDLDITNTRALSRWKLWRRVNFNKATCINVLQDFSNDERAAFLNWTIKNTRPGGKLFLSLVFSPYRGLPRAEIEGSIVSILEQHGINSNSYQLEQIGNYTLIKIDIPD